MKKHLNKVFSVVTILALMLMALPTQSAQAIGGGSGSISLATLGAAYTQNFDTLANTGTTNNLTINGWFLDETGTSTRNNGQYAASTGSDNAGDIYSFGAASNTERAYGTLRSGTLVPIIGASFTNNTGENISSLVVSYTGEQWRAGVTNRNAADRLDFQVSTDATSLATGTWTDYDNLDLNSPNITAATNTLDGNASGNRANINFTIAGLNIVNGAVFWIRWTDFDISSSDDGLAIDDFSLTPTEADAAPFVSSMTPASGASNVALNANIDVTFSEPVIVGTWFDITCSSSGNHSAVPSGDGTTFTLDPDSDFTGGESCTLTVFAAQVTDQDTDDPPDNMSADFTSTFSTLSPACFASDTPIGSVQGMGNDAAITGTVTVQGTVVGDFEGSVPALRGFYLQDAGDGNPDSSDGIFVFNGNNNSVTAGQVVQVTGTAGETFGQTQLSGSLTIEDCGSTNTVTPTDINLPILAPVGGVSYFERFEGMLVRFPQALVISEYFNYDRFVEMVLAQPLPGETRAFTPTSIVEPGAPAQARALANSLSRITLDDGSNAENPSFTRHPNGAAFTLDNRFRGGDTVQNTVGVLGFGFSLYRIQPTAPAEYEAVNPRPDEPEDVGGTLRLAAMNTLNFFITLDYPTGNPLDNKCGPAQNVECRGADSNQPSEFTRQRDKLLAALVGLDADVIGLNEIENTTGVEPLGDPTNGIVAGLNSMLGAGTYDYIDTGVIGTDAIRVGLIYKPGKVQPVGDFQTLDTSDDPRFLDNRNRPALAQTFEDLATGAHFTVVVNHLKSKGDSGLAATTPTLGICVDADPGNDTPDCDQGDGQGYWNYTRTQAARALVDWIATDPTGSGDPDFIIMGDLNSYAQEDPIDAVKAGADDTAGTGDDYTNLIFQSQGTYAYSYVFDGQAGYLDHALANPSMTAQVTAAADWHINADEPDLLDYDTSFKSAQQDLLYEPNAYRSSDHDPVIVGLGLDLNATCNGLPATIVGTTGNDVLNGTNGPDVIAGLGGNDVINGGNGDDIICGYAGNDTLNGGGGNDTLLGSYGTDTLNGQNGLDTLDGGDGDDTLDGGNDPDTLNGGNGSDGLIGGSGDDTLNGGADNDSLAGNNGNDSLTGGTGADRFSGGAGNDTNTDFNAGQGDTNDGT